MKRHAHSFVFVMFDLFYWKINPNFKLLYNKNNLQTITIEIYLQWKPLKRQSNYQMSFHFIEQLLFFRELFAIPQWDC